MAGALKMEKVEEKVETKVVEKPVAEKVPDDGMMGFYPIKDLPSKYKLYPEGTLIYGFLCPEKRLSHFLKSSI